MRVRLVFPQVEREPEGRPEKCEGRGSGAFRRFGKVERAIRDTRVEKVVRQRWLCKKCGKTTSTYPIGVMPKARESGEEEGFERGAAGVWAFLREGVLGSGGA